MKPTATTTTPTLADPDAGAAPRRRWARAARILTMVAAGLLIATLAGLWFSPIGARWRADADDAPPVTGVTTIEIADSTFGPASVQAAVGTELTWTWVDGEAHDIVFVDGPSAGVQAQGTWSRTFEAAGEYRYSCTLHAFMDGRVVVTEG